MLFFIFFFKGNLKIKITTTLNQKAFVKCPPPSGTVAMLVNRRKQIEANVKSFVLYLQRDVRGKRSIQILLIRRLKGAWLLLFTKRNVRRITRRGLYHKNARCKATRKYMKILSILFFSLRKHTSFHGLPQRIGAGGGRYTTSVFSGYLFLVSTHFVRHDMTWKKWNVNKTACEVRSGNEFSAHPSASWPVLASTMICVLFCF